MTAMNYKGLICTKGELPEAKTNQWGSQLIRSADKRAENEQQWRVKTCVDRTLPTEALLAASRAAIAENPANASSVPHTRSLSGALIDSPVALAALTGKLWMPGRTLRVTFLDGDPMVQARVAAVAQEWSNYANIYFAFAPTFNADAEIRISFQQAGSWSYIGTDALAVAKDQPTMNFGWLTPTTPDDEYARVVIHEFGHAIGCIHEHQNPATNVPWNKEAVYAYYAAAPNHWTRVQTDVNLFTRYSATLTQFSQFDRDSIMLYPIPQEFTVGDFEVGWNRELSAQDQRFIGTLYPKTAEPETELAVDAPDVNDQPASAHNCAIHACLERRLPTVAQPPRSDVGSDSAEPTRAALEQQKLWQPVGRTLRIRFLDGAPILRQKVATFAQQWRQYANLVFAFGDDPNAEIRISFRQPGSWSYIGTDALAVPRNEPTMNFGWLTPATANDEVMRVVLHEFGHAIGLIHEHQNPATTIPWNRDAVYAYYSGPPNYWTRDEVDRNLFQLYNRDTTQFSAFDRQSIMLYPIPQEFTHGGFTVGWNQCLSDVDKAFVAAWYPFPHERDSDQSIAA